MTGEYRLVPVEILDRFPEFNPSNYDHDDACALNEWGVEVVLASVSIPTAGNVVIAQEPKNSGAPVTLTYRNYRGEVADRTITPKRVWFGSTKWHPEPQWLMTAFDHEKQADRDFALKDFGAAIPAAPQPEPPADLVERAYEFLQRPRDHKKFGPVEALTAFAAEYATEASGRYRIVVNDLIASARTLEARAEFAVGEAEQIHMEAGLRISELLEALRARNREVELLQRKLTLEREACAKVADAERCIASPHSDYARGRNVTAFGIAAAIRARKGGGDA